MAKKPVKVKEKPKEQKVQEKKVKLSQGQKNRLRKKRKKVREYLERILSSGSPVGSNKSSDESIHSTAKSSKTNSSDTNLRTKEKKEKVIGDESDVSKLDKPRSGDESGSSRPEEPLVEVKSEDSVLTMNDENFPSLSKGISKTPKDRQTWVKLFK
ncbi:hypothetical protein Hanom_Chr10g00904131 [Helianthus anomalus]